MSQRGGGWLLGCNFLPAVLWQLVFCVKGRSARGWSAMCDCGISWSYTLIF